MAGRGAAPREHRSRASDDRARQDEMVQVAPDGEVYGPELPKGLPKGRRWPAQTKRWWQTWRTTAIAHTLTDTDWDFLLDTAVLHARYWGGDVTVANELRLRVAKYGATPEDRMRLKIQVIRTDASPVQAPAPVADADRKGRLLSAVE